MRGRRTFLWIMAAWLAAVHALAADSPASASPTLNATLPLSRIAFGSCNNQRRPQPLWEPIIASKPQLFVWLGDIIYADTENMVRMERDYDLQKRQPDYQRLRTACPIVGVWDDHDYGVNDGGKEYPKKVDSQRLLLDFLDEPADSPRRKQDGVFASYTYGPPGKRAKIILLDVRYHRDPHGPEGDTLGEAQWTWLDHELTASDAQLCLIGSGIEVVAKGHPYEKWAVFPKARDRLFKLIASTKARGVMFLSGDRHLAEISKLAETPAGYPFYDFTSSGLTHSGNIKREGNRNRVGELFSGLNYGFILIDWEANPVTITLQIVTTGGKVVGEQQIKLSELQPSP